MKNNIKKGLLFIITIIYFLIAAEIAARVTFPSRSGIIEPETLIKDELIISDNKNLGWELVPSKSDTNELGFRRESRITGEKIILSIGNSITYGLGVPYNNSYPAIVESILGNNYSVVNAGVPGYGLPQYFEVLKTKSEKIEPSPNIIIMGFSPGDFQISPTIINIRGKYYLFNHPEYSPFILNEKIHYFLVDRSSFYNLLYNSAERLNLREYNPGNIVKLSDKTKNIIMDVKEYTERNEQELIVLLFLPIEERYDDYDWKNLYEELMAFLEENNIIYIYPIGIYKDYGMDLRLNDHPEDFEHLNALGYEKVGELVAEKIRSLE